MYTGDNYSLDRLTRLGILPCDAYSFITGEPSGTSTQHSVDMSGVKPGNKLSGQPIIDQYNPQKMMNDAQGGSSLWEKAKTVGAIALGTYILGLICSKGKKNPIEGMKAIGKVISWPFKKIINFIKKP